jgi:hypothetical protein
MATKKKEDSVEVIEAPSNPLDAITGKYTVKSVRKTWLNHLNPNDDEGRIFDRAIYSYTVELDSDLKGAVNTGLTPQEQHAFEEALNYTKGSLSPFNLKKVNKDSGEFSWANFRINVPSQGLVLDADRSVLDKLRIKILRAGSKVAESTAEYQINPVRYELLLVSEESEAKVSKKIADTKKKAYLKFSDMSLQDMIDFLSVYDEGKYRANNDSTPDWIESQVSKVVDSEPDKFLELLDAPHYKTMIFLFKCINRNIVRRVGSRYLTYSDEVIGNTLAEAVMNLQDENYQSMKISLQTKLDDPSSDAS